MSTNHTRNYALSQWEASDQVVRTDFNTDNAKIDAALKRQEGQLLGVPALGRNLYNLFLRQKRAGQDVSWMSGLVYDDFTDGSKIESLGEGMSRSTSERCIHFTPVNGQLSASLVTTTQKLPMAYAHAVVWVRHSIAQTPVVERWYSGANQWRALECDRNGSDYWSATITGERCAEGVFFQPFSMNGTESVKLRITLTALDAASLWPVKLYDFGCMLI